MPTFWLWSELQVLFKYKIPHAKFYLTNSRWEPVVTAWQLIQTLAQESTRICHILNFLSFHLNSKSFTFEQSILMKANYLDPRQKAMKGKKQKQKQTRKDNNNQFSDCNCLTVKPWYFLSSMLQSIHRAVFPPLSWSNSLHPSFKISVPNV